MATSETLTLDARDLAPRDRHERIFSELEALAPDGMLELINDHDPKPLWYQLQAEQPGQFQWTYLEEGPECWRVRIKRTGAAPTTSPPVEAPSPASEPPSLDCRDLEPPEPLIRILEALNQLPSGQSLTAQLDREPLLLYPRLAQRGFDSETTAQADGSYHVRIWHNA